MKVGTFKSGHELWRMGRRLTDGGTGRLWRCETPGGELHGESKAPCRHLRRFFRATTEGTIPNGFELTAEGKREATKCGCLRRAGGFRPPTEPQPTPPNPDGNAAERRKRRRAGEREEKRVAWLSREAREAQGRATRAAVAAQRAETSAEAAEAAAGAALAAAEARAAAERAKGTAGHARARAAASRTKHLQAIAEMAARAAAAVERAHAPRPKRKSKRDTSASSTSPFETRGVLAAAYPGGRKSGRRLDQPMLTHTLNVETEAVLCGRVKPEHLADEFATDVQKRPTCPLCARRDPRFTKKSRK